MERLLTPPDPPLTSEGFRLRPFTVEDAEAIKAAGQDLTSCATRSCQLLRPMRRRSNG